jgi:hypothetical protein
VKQGYATSSSHEASYISCCCVTAFSPRVSVYKDVSRLTLLLRCRMVLSHKLPFSVCVYLSIPIVNCAACNAGEYSSASSITCRQRTPAVCIDSVEQVSECPYIDVRCFVYASPTIASTIGLDTPPASVKVGVTEDADDMQVPTSDGIGRYISC